MTIFDNVSIGLKNHRYSSFVVVALLSVVLLASAWIAWQPTASAEELEPLTIDTDLQRTATHPWTIDTEKSSLKIRINQKGDLVEGTFSKWNAQINLDPENLDTAFVDARIDMTSLELGELSEHAKSTDFLNTEGHAEARFLSDFFWLRGDGKVDAEGILEIAGVTKPFVLTFALGIDGQLANMSSYTVINRIDFGVGDEEFGDEENVGLNVEVAIDLIAEKQW